MASEDKVEETTDDFRRSFVFRVDEEEKTFHLKMPTSEQIRQAEWHYSKVYNKALVEGVATQSEMMDILTKRGIYGPDYEKKLQDLQVTIALTIAEMGNEANPSRKEALAKEVQKLRDELYRWNQRITGPLSNCCEQMADDAKTEYLTSVVVRDNNEKPIWKSYEDFVVEKNQALALKARFETLLWLQGLDADFMEKTPENRVLKELSKQKLEAAEEAVERAQLEAPKIEVSEEPKVSAKKGRKATAK